MTRVFSDHPLVVRDTHRWHCLVDADLKWGLTSSYTSSCYTTMVEGCKSTATLDKRYGSYSCDRMGSCRLCLVQIEDSADPQKISHTWNQWCATELNLPGVVDNHHSCAPPCANATSVHPCLLQTNASCEELKGNTMQLSEELHSSLSHHPHLFFVCIEGYYCYRHNLTG